MAELQTAAGRRISYDIVGSGPPLLLVMGAGESRRLWTRQTAAFSPSFRVITFDNRDSGESNPETGSYTIADLAADAAALLDALGVGRAHVLGTSMGSMIASQLALDYSARVARLVLISLPAAGLQLSAPPRDAWNPDHVLWMRGMFPALAAPGHFETHPAALEDLVNLGGASRLTYEGLVRQIEAMRAFDVRSRLPQIQAPTLLLQGDCDPLIPLADAQAFAAAIPNAHLVAISGAGHLAFVEQPDQVNRAALEFISERLPQGAGG